MLNIGQSAQTLRFVYLCVYDRFDLKVGTFSYPNSSQRYIIVNTVFDDTNAEVVTEYISKILISLHNDDPRW